MKVGRTNRAPVVKEVVHQFETDAERVDHARVLVENKIISMKKSSKQGGIVRAASAVSARRERILGSADPDVGNDVDVAAGVLDPGLHDAVAEVQAVHLRPHEVVVDLLRHGPRRRLQLGELALEALEGTVLAGNGLRGEVRLVLLEHALLEAAELLEEGDERRVPVPVAATLLLSTGLPCCHCC